IAVGVQFDAAVLIPRNQVAVAGVDAADRVVPSIEPDAAARVAKRRGSGGVGADLVASDAVSGRSRQVEVDSVTVSAGDEIVRDCVVRGVDADPGAGRVRGSEAVAELERAGDV